MLRSIFSLLLIFCLSITGILAQDIVSSNDNSCPFCKNGVHTDSAPYDFKLKSEWSFLAVGAISLASGIVAQNINHPTAFTESELMNLDRNDIFFIDRGATDNWSPASHYISNVVRSTSILFPAFFLTDHHTKNEISMLLVMTLEVLSTNFGVTMLVKNIVNRPRPFTYNTNLDISIRSNKNDKLSFFSGHTSHTAAFTFFIAKVMTDYHPNAKGKFKAIVWSGATLIPTATAILRVKAGKHFPTDVIAGYIVGASIGFLIPHLHKRKKEKFTSLSLTPSFTGSGRGISLAYRF